MSICPGRVHPEFKKNAPCFQFRVHFILFCVETGMIPVASPPKCCKFCCFAAEAGAFRRIYSAKPCFVMLLRFNRRMRSILRLKLLFLKGSGNVGLPGREIRIVTHSAPCNFRFSAVLIPPQAAHGPGSTGGADSEPLDPFTLRARHPILLLSSCIRPRPCRKSA